MGPFLYGFSGAIFQKDNAHPLAAKVSQGFLRNIQTLLWPASTPNCYPLEHVWDHLKHQTFSFHFVHNLKTAVQDIWAICLRWISDVNFTQFWPVLRHALEKEAIRYATEVEVYLSKYTHCNCLIVFILEWNECFIYIIICIKNHLNSMLLSWTLTVGSFLSHWMIDLWLFLCSMYLCVYI